MSPKSSNKKSLECFLFKLCLLCKQYHLMIINGRTDLEDLFFLKENHSGGHCLICKAYR